MHSVCLFYLNINLLASIFIVKDLLTLMEFPIRFEYVLCFVELLKQAIKLCLCIPLLFCTTHYYLLSSWNFNFLVFSLI